ncbi:MAG: alpha/beta hydrolase fold domain-containing protein [Paludibacter sp.]
MSKIKHKSKKIKLIAWGIIMFLTAGLSFNLTAQTVVTLSTGTSWTCPAGVNTIQLECWGAGGGGGGATSAAGRAGGGGAGGSYVKNNSIDVVPGTTYTISIGAGGIAGTSSSTSCNGASGGNTTATIGSVTITAVGGAGGTGGASATGGIGTGGTGSTTGNVGFSESFNYAGGNGVNGILSTRTGGGGGAAGSNGAGGNASSTDVTGGIAGTGGGNGANGITATAVGNAGSVPGGGGSGGFGSAKAGGAGGAGRIVITYSTGPAIPKWTAGWPKIEITSYTSLTAKANTNTAGNVYFVILPGGATAPTSAQVKAGQDASGADVAKKGTISCAQATTEYTMDVMGLSESTTYDVYFVAEDNVPTLQLTPAKVSITFGSSSKTDQTITFPAIDNKAVGDADFSPTAFASSDLSINYTSSNLAVATIVSGNIHIVGAGTTTITASQPGDANFNPAVSVSQTLTVTTVTKLNQTITFPAIIAKAVSEADFDALATASSGLAVTLVSSNTAVATIVSGKIHIVGAGKSTITASQAGNGTYNAASDVSQLLTVVGAKQNQTITFPALPNVVNVGDADLTPGATTDAVYVAPVDPNLFLNTTRFAAVTVTSGVKFATVTNYKGVVQDLSCDIYQPTGDVSTDRPCIIWMHGGGFRTGSVRTQGYIVTYSTAFAKRGYVCISIDYRLRAAADMPTQADEFPALQDGSRDANTALDWVRANAATYKINPNYLFFAGGSAGGRIAGTAAEFDGPDPTATTAPETAYKTKAWDKTGLIATGILWGGQEVEMRAWCYPYLAANPIPAVLVHGDADTTIPVQNSIDLATAMTAAGVTNELHIMPGAAHTPTGSSTDPTIQKWMGDFFVNEWKKVLPSGSYPITYTSSDPSVATIVNGKIHIVGNGTTLITATQAGDVLYNSAQASRTLTVGGTGVTGISENNRNVNVFNVVSNSQPIRIGLSGYTEKEVLISISSLQGQQLFERNYAVQSTIQINPEFMPQGGTYLINVKSGTSIITKKLIVK